VEYYRSLSPDTEPLDVSALKGNVADVEGRVVPQAPTVTQ
jgi:hypothetical protein